MNSTRVSVAILLLCAVVLEGGSSPSLAQGGLALTPTLTPATLSALTFRTVGPAAMSGRFVDIAVVESNTSIFYVASATGGLWKTSDNGTTSSSGVPAGASVLSCSAWMRGINDPSAR